MDEPETEQIYDANDNLLWEGTGNKKRPYEYLLFWAKRIRGHRDSFTQQQMKQIQMITVANARPNIFVVYHLAVLRPESVVPR